MGLYESYSSDEHQSEWDRSISDELNQGVDLPDAVRQASHDNEKFEARMATAITMGMIAAAAVYEVRRYRRNH